MRFRDRADGGRQLAVRLRAHTDGDAIVLGLPRGGVVVAAEVARALDLPLDVVVSRKLGAPYQPELAIGAIAPGASVLREELVEMLGISEQEVARITQRETARLAEYERRFRGDRPSPELAGRTVIIVDDGLATGATATAAVRSARTKGPARVIVAAPVCAPETVDALRREADEVVCVDQPDDFRAVGLWYEDFAQVTDEEVEALLDERANAPRAGSPAPGRT